jgi:hypothetical protein
MEKSKILDMSLYFFHPRDYSTMHVLSFHVSPYQKPVCISYFPAAVYMPHPSECPSKQTNRTHQFQVCAHDVNVLRKNINTINARSPGKN